MVQASKCVVSACLVAGLVPHAYAWDGPVTELHVGRQAMNRSALSGPLFDNVFEARDAIRRGVGKGTKRIVYLSSDVDHVLKEPFELEAADSGSTDAPIVYTSSSPHSAARITGGVDIPTTAFQPASVPSGVQGVMKANLFDCCGIKETDLGKMANPYPSSKMELFYDLKPSVLARHPNIAEDGTWMWSGYENFTKNHLTNSTFELADADLVQKKLGPALAGGNSTGELWLHGYFKFDWRETYIKVQGIDPSPGAAGAFTVTRDSTTPPQYPFTAGARFYALNSLHLLDAPNEYWISDDGWLYFLPPKPLTAGVSIKVSVLKNIISNNGANHTTFDNLFVSESRGTGMVVTSATAVSISNCTIANTGAGSCVSLSGTHSTITDSTVYGCGGSGVSIHGGDLSTLVPGNMSAVRNHIYNFSRIMRTYKPAIGFSGVGSYIANNTISHVPHTAIQGGGNDNLFEFNRIDHACYECTDTGAFYVGRSWSQRGNVVRYNVFDTVKPTERLAQKSCSQNAFYLDDEMSGYDFYGNTIINASTGVLLGGGRDNRIHHNTFIDNDADIHFDNRGMNWQAGYCSPTCTGTACFKTELEAIHYTQPPYSTRYPELPGVYKNHPCVPVNNVIEDNTYCHKHSEASSPKFIDRTAEVIKSWFSSISNNTEAC